MASHLPVSYNSLPTTSSQADMADSQSTAYRPMFLADEYPQDEKNHHAVHGLKKEDEALKRRIRLLRVVSRVLSVILSLAVFVPIALTFNVFLNTRSTVKGVSTASGTVYRTAWAKNTNAWPTYMYFAIALVSLVLNFAILVSYMRSVKTANVTATVSTVFNWMVIASNLVVWTVAVVLYRTEKDKGGKHDDLWGWTCSEGARLIQSTFEEVNFNRYCSIQSASWYAGILQVASVVLSGAIYYLAILRRRAKREVRRSMTQTLTGAEHR